MGIYLEPSALVELVASEAVPESLRRYLRDRPERVSSVPARVEVLRAVRQQVASIQDRAGKVLARNRLLELGDELLDAAAALSLDAIHLASARALGPDLEGLVTYDGRMAEAAALIGLPVQAPGAPADRPPRRRQGGAARR